MALAQVFRHFNGYAHVLVAAPSAVDALNTLALELEHVARLRALVYGVAHLAVERRHRDFRAECSLRECDWHIAPNVVAAARENGMRTNCNVYVQVAVRTAVGAGIALAADIQNLIVIDTRRNGNLDRLLTADLALAVARFARGIDNLASAVAAVARACGLHHAERCALVDAHLAGAAAVRTGLGACALSRAGAVAIRAIFDLVVGHIFLAALCRFLKRKGDARLHVTAAARCVRVRTASAAPETAAEEAVENIGKIKTACAAGIRISAARAASEVRVYARKAELVVARLLVFIRKYLIRFVDFLKLRFRIFISGIQVRVVLLCKLAVRLFNHIVCCALIDPKHFIIIFFVVRHPLSSPRKLQKARDAFRLPLRF